MPTLGLQNGWKGQRTVSLKGWLIQGLGSNSEVRRTGGIRQHTQEKLQELVFLLLFASPASNAGWTLASRQGRHHSMQQGAKSPLIPPQWRIWVGRARGQCCFLHIKDRQLQGLFHWGAAWPYTTSAPSQPRAPGKRQCAFSWVSGRISVCALRCVCLCLRWASESTWAAYAICLLAPPLHSSIVPQKHLCSSPVAPGRSHLAPMPQPLCYGWGEGYDWG